MIPRRPAAGTARAWPGPFLVLALILALLAPTVPPRPAPPPGRAPAPATWAQRSIAAPDGAEAVLVPGRGACLVDRGRGEWLLFFAAPGGGSGDAADARCPSPAPGAHLVGAGPDGPLLLAADKRRLWAWGWGEGPRWAWSPAQGQVEWASPAADGGAVALSRGRPAGSDGAGSPGFPDSLWALGPKGSELWRLDFSASIPVLAAAAPGGGAAVAVVQAGAEGLASELWFVGADGVVCGRVAYGPPPPHLLGFAPGLWLLAVSEDRWRSYSWPARLEGEGAAAGLALAAAAGAEGRIAVALAAGSRPRLLLAGGGMQQRVVSPGRAGTPLALDFLGGDVVLAGREGLALFSPSGRAGVENRFEDGPAGRGWAAGDLVLVDMGGGRMELFRVTVGGEGR